uniref:Large ribosomal subunit protein bL20c n=1 Tax=Spirogyra maxima TaxID=3180 RepID=A0A191T4I8_SPIMX|nr:ribosomal protein L20 [Spirogyra maxima]ANI25310.1 ribosomal protein L20 [Spirogyra maxima]
MTRVKRGYVAKRRRNNILKFTAGSRRAHSRLIRPAIQQRIKALACSHRDRGKRKRNFRKLWIIRMNAASRQHDLNYSQLIHQLYKEKALLNRKILAQLAILDDTIFSFILSQVSKDNDTIQLPLFAGPSSQ